MLPWDLEDWITDTGADVLEKRLANANALSSIEELIYQIWLLDTEARNGGMSQYFCNHGVEQWQACQAVAHAGKLSAFVPFSDALNSIVAGTPDPYFAIRELGDPAEDLWLRYQLGVVQQLKGLWHNEASC